MRWPFVLSLSKETASFLRTCVAKVSGATQDRLVERCNLSLDGTAQPNRIE